MKWINSGDIRIWVNGNQRKCAGMLPELIRRLVLATATTVEEIDFPSGDSIAYSGWDGRLRTPVASPFFPTGSSGWEIGTEDTPGKKAEEDYTKREADSLGLVQSDTSFVFVTPRPWPGRVQWQNDKRATGVWKDVRVIAADGLEQWLELAPAVALWLGRKIKGLSDSLRDIEGYWEEWSASTDPKMTTETVVAGRTRDLHRIHDWLRGKAAILEVRGDSPDEPYAFLYASIMNLPEQERTQALSRCILVENVQQVRSCANTFQNPLIIVAPAECREASGLAVDRGHHVFISADARSIDFRNNLMELSRPQRDVVERGLRDGSLTEAEARKISRDFGRSIPVLRRHLFRSSARTPDWSDDKSAQNLIPLLFAGAWDEHRDGDRSVIESLAGTTHDEYVKALRPFLSIDDSPIRLIGTVWMLKSPLDVWYLLAPHLTEDHLKLFERAVVAVLTKTDPKYDLGAEKRWMASMYGKSSPFSGWVRVGLVESLILVAVYGDRSPHVASTQVFADRVVKDVLAHADKWESWASIKDVTSLLAEASPNAFMDAVESVLSKLPKLFEELMSDDGTLFGECRHSGLLWALEGIAWNPEYLTRAATIFFNLSGLDSGGRWINHPQNSLKDVFMPGLPQTNATPEQRLTVWDALVEEDPARVWKFARSYYNGGSMDESHQFRWRDAGGSRRPLEQESSESYREYIKGLAPRLRELASRRENLVAATDEFTRLPEDVRARLLTKLEADGTESFSRDEREEILRCLREALNWINNHGDEDRRRQLPELWRVYNSFLPADLIERHGWMLSNPWPCRPEGDSRDYNRHESEVKEAQKTAAREVLNQVSLERVVEFATTIQYPGVLGYSLGKAVKDADEDAKVLDALIEKVDKCPVTVRGFAQARVEKQGHGWIDQQIERIKTKGSYTPETCALLYFGREESAVTWSAVAAHGKAVWDAYWRQATGYSRSSKEMDAPIAVENLLNANRPGAALQVAGDPKVSIPSPLLQRLLQDLLGVDAKDRNQVMDEYYIGNIFNQLYQRDDLPLEEMAKLEWPYAGIFDDIKRYTSSSMALHRVLQKDPAFFAQLISFIYKRDDRKPDTPTDGIDEEMLKRRWRVAHDVLDSWYLLPGVQNDGSIDEKTLAVWITGARDRCAEDDRVTGGDIEIGFILAHAPADPDGTWPHTAVRNVIEKLNNQTIDRHIENEIYNSRGTVSKGLNDGGRQEREIAERYKRMSDTVTTKWPRTGALLKALSESYTYEARSEDIEADLNDLRWG